MLAAADVRVHPSGEELGEHASRRPAAVHPADEARVDVARREGQDRAERGRGGRRGAGALDRQRLAQRGARRHRGPAARPAARAPCADDSIASSSTQMRELLERTPVGRIEQACRGVADMTLGRGVVPASFRPPEIRSSALTKRVGLPLFGCPRRSGDVVGSHHGQAVPGRLARDRHPRVAARAGAGREGAPAAEQIGPRKCSNHNSGGAPRTTSDTFATQCSGV